jgi:transglutaminase-like putative cysteine protease
MRYRVTHTTTYDYSEPVLLCQNLAHLTPRHVPEQQCKQTSISINPHPAVLSNRIDYFGNPSTFFTLQEPHRQLTMTANSVIELQPRFVPEAERSLPWEQVRDQFLVDHAPAILDACQFAFGSRYANPDAALADYALPSFTPCRPILDAARDLTRRIHADFQYDPKATTVATPLQEVFSRRRGVCQDFAHLQIACMRSLGLAARYVSGYLCTEPPPGQARLIGADATHAWLSVYCPGCGWMDVDPTNDQVPSDKHILLAWGRDYDDVSPIKGVILGGGQHTVRVSVSVVPLDEGMVGTQVG